MAFDDQTRRRLLKMVTACRSLLTGDFDEQLRSHYGIYAKEGRVFDIEKLTALDDTERETARLLRERIDHLAGGKGAEAISEAVGRILREQAFTVMNRLAAIRMAEERKIIKQSVGGGLQSNGFRVFEQAAGASSAALGSQYERYLVYLDCLFDELSLDLGVLFDRSDALGLLFPTENAVRELFEELNHLDIAELWPLDETIGWIYQYWNSKEERKAMRDASAAPRNSRELAVRNQFFTPRYVVEFLTDNTLGRIWYEMTKGQTRLKEQCRYLVRRPMEIFLPGPDTNFWHDAGGTDEFRKFSSTADLEQLPEDPVLGVLLGWVGSLKTLGFEDELRLIGLTHQEVMDVLFHPMERGETPEGLEAAHPIVLLQILWRLSYEADKHGYGDLRSTASSDPVAGPTWSILQKKLNAENQELGQDELLKLPVFIPHRPFKDPREIRLLDPACGSMHFGLYAFDLFEVIYEEAWDLGQIPKNEFGIEIPPFPHEAIEKKETQCVHSNDLHEDIDAGTARVVMLKESDMGDGMFHTGPYLAPPERSYRPGIAKELPFREFNYQAALASGWITREEGERFVRETNAFDHDRCDPLSEEEAVENYLRQVPRLVIEHNIHGVDIDPRAVQIAGLSLWLRAQKSWAVIPVADRPQVRRSNIVCAEPMPGSEAMLDDFVQTLDPPLLGEFVKTVFDKMQLAGEAGTLLKIEEEIRTAINVAREKWENLESKPRELFSTDELNRVSDQPEHSRLDTALRAPGSQITGDFFDTAEERIYAALRAYAESAEAGDYQRRLFAEDAAHGFAFIDLCRKRYEAVVMNPPFGVGSSALQEYLKGRDRAVWTELFASMVSRATNLSPAGLVGAITARTCLSLSRLSEWRQRDLVPSLELVADLGLGVMDDALVEACAYICRPKSNNPFIMARRVPCDNSPEFQLSATHWILGDKTDYIFRELVEKLPEHRILIGVSSAVLRLLDTAKRFEPTVGTVRRGFVLFDGFRFIRLFWEVPLLGIGSNRSWAWYSKGGSFQRHYGSVHIVALRAKNGAEMCALNLSKNGQTAQAMQGSKYYFRSGATFTSRSQRGFAGRCLPAGCITSDSPAVLSESDASDLLIVGWLSSRVVRLLIELQASFHKYEPGNVKSLPWPVTLKESSINEIEALTASNIALTRELSTWEEADPNFDTVFRGNSISSMHDAWQVRYRLSCEEISKNQSRLSEIFDLVYCCDSESAFEVLDGIEGDNVVSISPRILIDFASGLESWSVGVAFGRWDVRYATGERQLPELPDPFDPLPVCPPGMLQNANGMPAAPAEVPDDYPLDITWSGILVDEENHPDDIIGRVREAIRVIWNDKADAIEQEACEILKVKDKPRENLDALRVYFRDSNKFFKDHLARYSKSRRKAPIYWPLSTESGSFTLWIYYPRLDNQTLYTCIDIVEKKREDIGSTTQTLRSKIGTEGSADENQKLEDLTEFQSELKTFQERLLEVAALPYRPNLNDGVQITAAPLWQLFRHKPWQTVLKKTWEELKKGKYDWAHLAMSIWPDRVVPLCNKDRSLAIAHGVEDLFWVPDLESKKKEQLRPLKSPEEEIKLLRKADFSAEDIKAAEDDAELAKKTGIGDHLWVEQPEGNWRRRLSLKEELEGEVARRKRS